MRITVADYVRLEVLTTEWVDIAGPSKSITIDRSDSDVGLMSAEVLDASLDPVHVGTLRPGTKVRVRALDGVTWRPIYTGLIDNVSVDYSPLAPEGKRVNVKISASDNVSFLANAPERRGVATINDLRWVLAGTGVPFNINGQTTALSTGEVVATNDNGTLWDCIQLAKDSNLGYAWVDKDNRLRVYDLAQMDNTVKASLTTSVYRDVDADFNLDQIINSVLVKWLRFDDRTGTTAEITYPAVEDAASIAEWGRRQAIFTIAGAEEVEADIVAFANNVLARSATAVVRPRTADVRIKQASEMAYTLLDLNDRVQVTMTDDVTVHDMRVSGVKHTITPEAWDVSFEFAVPTSVSPPNNAPRTGITLVPPGSVGLDSLDGDLATSLLSADGKTRNYYSHTEPTDGPFTVGDTWFDTDDSNQIHRWDGTAWVATLLGTNAIAEASIVNALIADAAINNAKIANVDAGKVTTGFLDTARLKAKSVSVAKHLAVGDFTDLVPDPFMQQPLGSDDGWSIVAGSPAKWANVTLGSPYLTPGGRGTMLRLSQSDGNVTYAASPAFPVEAGEQFRIEGRMRRWGGTMTGGNFLIGMIFRNAAGAQVGSGYAQIPYNALTTYDNWFDATVTATAPVGAVSGSVLLHSNTIATSGVVVDFSEVHARRMMTGRLIVNGAIDGQEMNGVTVNAGPAGGPQIQISGFANPVTGLSQGFARYTNPGFAGWSPGMQFGQWWSSGGKNWGAIRTYAPYPTAQGVGSAGFVDVRTAHTGESELHVGADVANFYAKTFRFTSTDPSSVDFSMNTPGLNVFSFRANGNYTILDLALNQGTYGNETAIKAFHDGYAQGAFLTLQGSRVILNPTGSTGLDLWAGPQLGNTAQFFGNDNVGLRFGTNKVLFVEDSLGGLQQIRAYNVSLLSDPAAKEDVVPVEKEGVLDAIRQTTVYDYSPKGAEELLSKRVISSEQASQRFRGIMSDEALETIPEVVITPTEEDDHHAIDLYAYVGTLHVALQEMADKVDALEARLAALEGKS